MSQTVDFDIGRRTAALHALAANYQDAMLRRWPEIDFDGEIWPTKTRYSIDMTDVRFGPAIAAFAGRDSGYLLALRCQIAATALDGKIKEWDRIDKAWRLLAKHLAPAIPLAALRRHHLQGIEDKVTRAATPASALRDGTHLRTLATLLDDLARQGAVDRFLWRPSMATGQTLTKLRHEQDKARKNAKAEILDRQIEALSEATSAMLRNDERLDNVDRQCIAFTGVLMAAPSRVNEPMTCKISDRFTIEDYATRPNDRESDSLYRAHQLLLVKGSKGAAWSPKPILNFMIALVEQCWQVLLDGGKRSRMLVTWYEQHPDRLYLPPELKHLRGQPISSGSLWQIVNLTVDEPSKQQTGWVRESIWKAILDSKAGEAPAEVLIIDNPRQFQSNGSKTNAKKIKALPWDAVEAYLLKQVHARIAGMRKVTKQNNYEGCLSEMLVLSDSDITLYLPRALDYATLWARLKTPPGGSPSVFKKLGLRMSQGGMEVECFINTHDPRRWLTTQALAARERLSDVLINKWANRLSLQQLDAYDLRSDEQKADQAATPLPNELADLSKGLQELDEHASQYGLSTEIVVAHEAGISVTSMEAVCQATEDRPVARTGSQILILYPTSFGACVHPHHETPCRAYKCGPCDKQVTVKGHLPTNEAWRTENDKVYRSIINQLQNMITARNRGIADDPKAFDAHLLTLVKEGLDPQAMADDLIDRFHEIKDQIRDLNFRNELEEALVARGMVKRLDDPEVPSGALIKYHNPKRHAAPGHELAIEANFGSRDEMDHQSELFYQQNPELAPARLALQDQSHLLTDDDDDDDNDGAEYEATA